MQSEHLPLSEHLALDADEAERRAQRRRRLNELDAAIDAALRRIEPRLHGQDVHKVMAQVLGVSTTQVHDWIARRGYRRPPAELFDELLDDEVLFAWLAERHGYEAPRKKPPVRTAEQERELYRSALRRFGEEGQRALREVDSARPRPQVVASGETP